MPKNKGGQPTKFSITMQKIAAAAYKFGATDVEVAEVLEVTEKTIHNWKRAHPRFFQSRKESKAAANSNVVRSLYERATGYTHPEEKVFCVQGEIITYQTTRHYPPDPTSMIFFLKNRDPEAWRDMKNVDIQIMSDEDRMNRIDALLQSVLDREVAELTQH